MTSAAIAGDTVQLAYVDQSRALEDALDQFAGCAIVISHDRWFLDRSATHILAFGGEGNVASHDGDLGEYDARRKQRLGNAAQWPHRTTYRTLTR